MIDCFVLAGVKTLSQRGTLPTRQVVAALFVLCFAPSPSPAFSGVLSHPTDSRITYSRLRARRHRFQRYLHTEIHHVRLSRASVGSLLLISLIYLYFSLAHDPRTLHRPTRSYFPPDVRSSLSLSLSASAYYLFRRDISRR